MNNWHFINIEIWLNSTANLTIPKCTGCAHDIIVRVILI